MKSPYEDPPVDPDANLEASKSEQRAVGTASPGRTWVWTCLIIAAFSILYRLIVWQNLEQTSLMFIGLPTALAIALGLTPSPVSMTGRILKGMTLSLLVCGILLVEGTVCLLMAAPLFYLIGIFIGLVSDAKTWREGGTRMHSFVVGTLLLMSLEGTTDWLSFDRNETVVICGEFALTPEVALAALARAPEEFELGALPGFLKLGFPAPRSIEGKGIGIGSVWRIHFAGGEGEPGDLVVRVAESERGRVRFECLEDTSHIAHWMRWEEVVWEMAPSAGGGTHVTMTVRYVRELDPAWYFKPLERYGVGLAGDYFMGQIFR